MKKHPFLVILVLASLFLVLLALACLLDAPLRQRREARYLDEITLSAKEFDIPVPIVLAVIRTESDFRPNARSRAGALGLMQLMPETFAFLRDECLGEVLEDNAVLSPAVNIRYGTYYLSYLYQKFGDWRLTLAAYNAGERRVSEWLDDPALSPDGRLEHIPFPETAAYVEKVLLAYQKYNQKYKE
ncbi:MAG: lytic transglycosylase domain-containing protein [Clostridia bacterium]|nr:lytic transglycosylase domain-containing protein [Clostridia bacterium]